MKKRTQHADVKRRSPRQKRATETVEAIFEATAQILQREGRDHLSTNRIAERAGVSIGSLYQYFPDKNAILVAMAQREFAKGEAAALAAIAGAEGLPHEQRARRVIRALIATFDTRQRVRRHLLETLFAQGLHQELMRPVETIARAIARRAASAAPQLDPQSAPVQLFVLTRAVTGVIRAAVMEDSPLLGSPRLEEELVALISSYANHILAGSTATSRR
jgi:AcrR family transcriptional regulator